MFTWSFVIFTLSPEFSSLFYKLVPWGKGNIRACSCCPGSPCGFSRPAPQQPWPHTGGKKLRSVNRRQHSVMVKESGRDDHFATLAHLWAGAESLHPWDTLLQRRPDLKKRLS